MITYSTVGRLTKDAETTKTEGGFIVKITIASDDFGKGGTKTSFVNASLFTKNDSISKYLTKGKIVHAIGKIDISGTYTNFRVTEIKMF